MIYSNESPYKSKQYPFAMKKLVLIHPLITTNEIKNDWTQIVLPILISFQYYVYWKREYTGSADVKIRQMENKVII